MVISASLQDQELNLRDQHAVKILTKIKGINDRNQFVPSVATLQPLRKCRLSILWEMAQTTEYASFSDLAIDVLPAAVVYQANYLDDQLIAQSMICLRYTYEVLHSCVRLDHPHEHKQGICTIESIHNLRTSLKIYQQQLTRVFFQKENRKDKSRWWLPTFYSLYIQASVKTLLVRMGAYQAREYLDLPRRLFHATSGKYDPIWQPQIKAKSNQDHTPSQEESFAEARRAFQNINDELEDRPASIGMIGLAAYSGGVTNAVDLLRKMFKTWDKRGEDDDHTDNCDDDEILDSDVLDDGSGLSYSKISQFSSKVFLNIRKKHQCKVCDKRFTRETSLQTHMYSHTGEKPFACKVDGCGRHFSIVSNLHYHQKIHRDAACFEAEASEGDD